MNTKNKINGRIRRTLFTALLIFFATRLLIFGAAYAWLLFDPAKTALGPSEPIWHGDTAGHGAEAEPWRRWDALWFIKTVREGYVYKENAQSNTSVFPLYPMLIKGLSGLGLDPIWAGVIISNICLLGAIAFFLLLVERKGLARGDPARAVLAMLLFPSAFVLSAVYSESLFLFTSLAAFYFADKRNWPAAAIFGFAAAMTRFSGIVLVLPLALMFASRKPAGESLFRALWLLLIPIAPALFFIYLDYRTGSYMNYFHAQSHWQKVIDWPWAGLGWELFPWIWEPNRLLNIGSVLLFSGLCSAVWKRFGPAWGLYAALGILMPACAARWIGMPRYMLVLFPAFAALPLIIKNKWIYISYLTASTALMLWCFREFLNWHISL